MSTNDSEQRWQEIRSIHNTSKFFYQLLGGILLVLIGIYIGSRLFVNDTGYATNLYTEILSIGITIFILDALSRQREERREAARYKEQLIREMGSRDNGTALRAAEALRAHGWLKAGLLRKANLEEANLQRAELTHAELTGVNFWCADLRKVRMIHARLQNARMAGVDLRGAELNVANLSGAHVNQADLRGADLRWVNLENAYVAESDFKDVNLWNANLRGANLMDCNLEGANLKDAQFDEKTILPNHYMWTPAIDMSVFTDRDHPEFWRPEDERWRYEESDDPLRWWEIKGRR
jgi:hypothetical protein